MSRQFLTFTVAEDTLCATLDTPSDSTHDVGLFIVSGGNEIRSGAFAGQSDLARNIAHLGYPIFRFDRRGVGDSEGENAEFRSAGPDMSAALAAFREACPHIRRVVGFGNCDAAAALMLAGGAGCDALLLANPWTFDEGNEDAVPAEAARKRYAEKLSDPNEWSRLLKGKISLSSIIDGLKSSAALREHMSKLALEMLAGSQDFAGDYRYLIAGRDRTGLAFKAMWPKRENMHICPTADHAFSGAEESHWLQEQLRSALDEQARQLDMG